MCEWILSAMHLPHRHSMARSRRMSAKGAARPLSILTKTGIVGDAVGLRDSPYLL